MAIIEFTARLVSVMLDVVMIAMLARVIVSFISDESTPITLFLACITEPFIMPIRYFMVKYNILQDTPVDFSFTFTYLIISLVKLLLPVL